ncbi:MAG TPA: hypothetical protein V6C57_27415 [Coleofasciculaceae cyanobacterium]
MAYKTAKLEDYLAQPAIARIAAWYETANPEETLASLPPEDQAICEYDENAAIGFKLFNLLDEATGNDQLAARLNDYIIRTREHRG